MTEGESPTALALGVESVLASTSRKTHLYVNFAGRVKTKQSSHKAQQMLSMAKLTWCFDISAAGEDLDWDVESSYTDGFVFSPKRFPVSIKPRSCEHVAVIQKEFEAQREVFARYED